MYRDKESQSSWLIKLIILLGLVFVTLIGYSIYKETYKKKQVQDEINKLRDEASLIERENMKLSDRINYLESKDYQEKEAKDKFNLQNPSENVVIINPGVPKEQADGNAQQDTEKKVMVKKSNLEKWWDYFFIN